MNHVHDRAVSNGHLLTPCHVDFNSKDSYMVTIDVIALISFRQGITSSLSSVTSSKFFVIILAPTCYTFMALTASLQHFWFLPTFALARHPILWSWELFDLRSDSFYLCDLEVSFQQLCCGGGVAALTLICLSLKKKPQQLVWALKSIITPSILRQTWKHAANYQPSFRHFIKEPLNYMLWIMDWYWKLDFFISFIKEWHGWEAVFCTCILYHSSASLPQACHQQPQPLFTDMIKSQLSVKAFWASVQLVFEQMLRVCYLVIVVT